LTAEQVSAMLEEESVGGSELDQYESDLDVEVRIFLCLCSRGRKLVKISDVIVFCIGTMGTSLAMLVYVLMTLTKLCSVLLSSNNNCIYNEGIKGIII